MVWDVTTPIGTEAANQGDDRLRELKTDIQTSLRANAASGTEAVFPGADTANPVYRYRGLKDTTINRPAASNHGLFFDTTRNVVQRDNGATWDDIATLIPAGTVMVFYQAAAPTGWTKVVTQDDKALRVVSGSGGVAGGTVAFSAGISAHTHSIGADGSHGHIMASFATGVSKGAGTEVGYLSGAPTGPLVTIAGGASSYVTITPTTQTEPNHDHGGVTGSGGSASAFAYIDVILCSKD